MYCTFIIFWKSVNMYPAILTGVRHARHRLAKKERRLVEASSRWPTEEEQPKPEAPVGRPCTSSIGQTCCRVAQVLCFDRLMFWCNRRMFVKKQQHCYIETPPLGQSVGLSSSVSVSFIFGIFLFWTGTNCSLDVLVRDGRSSGLQ